MAAPFFPDVEQILDLVMAELPNGVYASDRADDPDESRRSYSSAELRAHAQLLANLYGNLQNINSDKYITTATETGVTAWEKELFSAIQDGSLPIEMRRNNLLAKIRANGGISLPAIRNIIAGILTPFGLTFEILSYCGQYNGNYYGSWILDYSSLDVDTYLATIDPLLGANRDETALDCSLDYEAAGLTEQDLIDIQNTAYTYEVQIFGNADAMTLSLLERTLTELEPARSTHIITNNAPGPIPPDTLDLGPFTSSYLINNIDCGNINMPPSTYHVMNFGSFV